MAASASSNGFLYYRIDQSTTLTLHPLLSRTRRKIIRAEGSFGYHAFFLSQLPDLFPKTSRQISNLTANYFHSPYDFQEFCSLQRSSQPLQAKISSTKIRFPKSLQSMNAIRGFFQTIPNYGPANPFSHSYSYYLIVTSRDPSAKLFARCQKMWLQIQNKSFNPGSIQLSFSNSLHNTPELLWCIGCSKKHILQKISNLFFLSKIHTSYIRTFKYIS